MQNETEKSLNVWCQQLIIALCAVVPFLPALFYGYVYDDAQHILKNQLIGRNFDLLSTLLSPTWPGNLYRPVLTLSFQLNYLLSGFSPGTYHLLNILLHMFVSLLVYELMTLLQQRLTALIVAVLFALHPAHLEVIANVAFRAESLATLGVLATLTVALSASLAVTSPSAQKTQLPTMRSALLAIFSASLAFFSKENACVLLLLMPLCLWWRYQKTSHFLKLTAFWLCLILIPFGLYLTLRIETLSGVIQLDHTISYVENFLLFSAGLERVLYACLLLGKYFALFLFPFPPRADYSFAALVPFTQMPVAEILICAGLFLVIFLSAVIGMLRARSYGFFAAWFLLSFILTCNLLFPIGVIYAERLIYLPSVGLAGLAGIIITNFPRKLTIHLLTSLISMLYFVVIARTLPSWTSDQHFWERQLELTPESSKVQANLGSVYFKAAQYERAVIRFEKALEIYPGNAQVVLLLARSYQLSGRYGDAQNIYARLTAKNPNSALAVDGLGWAKLGLKQYQAADVFFHQALQLDPQMLASQIGLFASAVEAKDYRRAQSEEQKLSAAARLDLRYREAKKKFDLLRTTSRLQP
ncbi:tetratricopeptide repeat protein [bacterium]|nr:tetratricopeptide repeat protein [bacterium]